jgi:hypothetical protein
MNFKGVIECLHGKFDNFDHSCDWFLDDFRNWLIVQVGFYEIWIYDSAEAKQDDIAEEFRVISWWISNERLFARLIDWLI